MGRGLRHESAPFQGWIGLKALFPGRCPGLSQGCPVGARGYGRSLCSLWYGDTCPNAARRNRWTNGPGIGRNVARRCGAPTRPALAATRPKEIAQGNALGTTPSNQPSPERAKRGPLPRLMFRIRDAVFSQSTPEFLPANIFRSKPAPSPSSSWRGGARIWAEDCGMQLRSFRAGLVWGRYSQGVAPGYRMAPRWGE